MRSIIIFVAVVLAGVFYVFHRPEDVATAEETINEPRAEVYARLDALYAAIERKSATITTVTGRPPIPATFTFQRRNGESIDMTATAGFRTVQLKVWLIDGAQPGETILKVKATPQSMLKKTGDTELQRAVQTVLEHTDAQFVEGHRVVALFGEGPNAIDVPSSN